MGFLIGEIIAFLAGAALVGVLIGWALFGGHKAAGGAKAGDVAPTDGTATKRLDKRVAGLEAERDGLQGKLSERDAKIAELRNHLDETSRYRVEMAEELNQQQERVKALEEQLRQRDAEMALGAEASGDATVAELERRLAEKDEAISQLDKGLRELEAAAPDAPRVAQLEAEIAELKATLESGGQIVTEGDPGHDKDAVIARLEEEITGLRAAYEAAERSLEEQDGAIDRLTQDLVKAQQKIGQLEMPRTQGVVEAEVLPEPSTTPPGEQAAGEAPTALHLPGETSPEAVAIAETQVAGADAGDATVAMPVFDLDLEDASDDEDEPTEAIAVFNAPGDDVPDEPLVPPPMPPGSPGLSPQTMDYAPSAVVAGERPSRPPQQPPHKSPSRPLHKSPSRRLHKSPSRRLHKSPSRRLHKSPSRPPHKSPSRPLHKSPSRPPHKSPPRPPRSARQQRRGPISPPLPRASRTTSSGSRASGRPSRGG